ncbi:MAG: FHA domain-containing protein [Gammaproteobacteria bacterium]|nr:FHA domain-containing protein [Gammaproteobacteria bacterium]
MYLNDRKRMNHPVNLLLVAVMAVCAPGFAEAEAAGTRNPSGHSTAGDGASRTSPPANNRTGSDHPSPPTSDPHMLATVTVRQASANGHELNFFVDVRDQAEKRVPQAKIENFKLDIGPYRADPKLLLEDDRISDVAPGLATIFLVDTSKSISEQTYSRIRSAIATWIKQMGASDKAAIITFGSQVTVTQDFTNNRDDLSSKVEQLKPVDPKTKLNDALLRALDFGQRRDADLPLRRAIVLLSDGMDDSADGASSQEVQMKLEQAPLPVYAISFESGLKATEREQGLRVLGSFAHASGGELLHAGKDLFQETYAKAHQKILETRLLRADCPECPPDGRVYPIQISYQDDGRILTGQGHVRMSVGVTNTVIPQPDNSVFDQFGNYLPPVLQPYSRMIAIIVGLCLISGMLYPIFRRLNRPRINAGTQDATNDGEEFISSQSSPEIADALAVATRSITVEGPQINPAPGVQLRLTAVKGRQVGKSWGFILKDQVVLGRSSSCDVSIDDDPEISGKHCVLIFRDGQLYVSDAQSMNGTTVNGVSITTAFKLEENDLIGLGRTALRLNRA